MSEILIIINGSYLENVVSCAALPIASLVQVADTPAKKPLKPSVLYILTTPSHMPETVPLFESKVKNTEYRKEGKVI